MTDEQVRYIEDRSSLRQAKQEDQTPETEGVPQRKCLTCGWSVSQTADICENCSEWLLKGKCCFCYSHVEEGQNFCSECGNPPTGVVCKACGKSSIFDYCPHCTVPLTEQANETLDNLRKAPEIQNVINMVSGDKDKSTQSGKHVNDELQKLKRYLSKTQEQKTKKKSFVLNDDSTKDVDDKIKAAEESGRKLRAEQQRIVQEQQELEALRQMEETKKKTFKSNQDARRYFGALKILIPAIIQKRKPIGWRCNVYGNTHSDGPQNCADPSAGGEYIFEIQIEHSTKEIEL